MGQDRDGFDLRVVLQIAQQLFEIVARIIGAVAVVIVGEHIAGRRPGEQDRRDVRIRPGIMQDLREAVDRVLEAVVEAVHEDEGLLLARLAEQA